MLLPILILAAAGFIIMKKVTGVGSTGSGSLSANPQVTRNNSWNLPDIDSSNQQGGFSSAYDESFEKASGATGVPFALLKAHAIRESSLNPNATHQDTATESSFGLMQVEWCTDPSSSLYDRLSKYGGAYSGDNIAANNMLSDPDTSAFLGASIISDNLGWLNPSGKNGLQGLRDVINAYNTGVAETTREAPSNYVNDVINYYQTLIGQSVP